MEAGKSTPVRPPSSSATRESTRGNVSNNEVNLVKVTVVKEHAVDVLYEIKRNSRLGRVMFDYCQVMGVNYKELRFTYLGKQVSDFDTPASLEMGDEEVIDCWSEQTGGGRVLPIFS